MSPASPMLSEVHHLPSWSFPDVRWQRRYRFALCERVVEDAVLQPSLGSTLCSDCGRIRVDMNLPEAW